MSNYFICDVMPISAVSCDSGSSLRVFTSSDYSVYSILYRREDLYLGYRVFHDKDSVICLFLLHSWNSKEGKLIENNSSGEKLWDKMNKEVKDLKRDEQLRDKSEANKTKK